jgi:hypothetical protein
LIDGISLITDDTKNGDDKVCAPSELQQRSCHPSAGPLLVHIIRILSYLDEHDVEFKKKKQDNHQSVADRRLVILPRESQYSSGSDAEALVHKLLCWDRTQTHTEGDKDDGETGSAQPYAGDIIYGLSGEPRGSILLETILRCCPDAFHDELCSIGGFYVEQTLREYAFHSVSNFVVQAILNSVRSKKQAAKLVKCLCGMIEDGSILKFTGDDDSSQGTNRRMGIVWRAMEMCVETGNSQDQEQIIHALMRGYASISAKQDDKGVDGEGEKRKKRSKAKGLSAQECIPLLIGLKSTSHNEERDSHSEFRLVLNASGARALHHIFHFSERLRSDWIKGIVRVYGQRDLVNIANDGLGSKW